MIIDSFCAARAKGNRHQVIVIDKPALGTSAFSVESPLLGLIKEQANTVLLWHDNGAWHARFFDRGNPVLRCGSGNIAVAAYLYTQQQEPFSQLLHTNAGTVTLGVDATSAYYRDRPCQPITTTDRLQWAYLCRAPVSEAVRIGARQDYTLVLQPNIEALLQLKLRNRALGLYSARSVIALAPAKQHWQLRYFAPQYGVIEDAATGSACVQATAYLARTGHGHRFTFVQRSRARGIIYTEFSPQEVTVRGDYHIKSH